MTYQPRLIPLVEIENERKINVASSGVVEQLFVYNATFLSCSAEFIVNHNGEAPAWNAWIVNSASQGVPFDYYPDSTVNSFTTYYLEDSGKITIEYKSLDLYSYKFRFRQFTTWP
jgi:hypothetical protein